MVSQTKFNYPTEGWTSTVGSLAPIVLAITNVKHKKVDVGFKRGRQ